MYDDTTDGYNVIVTEETSLPMIVRPPISADEMFACDKELIRALVMTEFPQAAVKHVTIDGLLSQPRRYTAVVTFSAESRYKQTCEVIRYRIEGGAALRERSVSQS